MIWNVHFLGRISKPVISTSLLCPKDVGPNLIAFIPFLSDFVWIFLYILSFKIIFLPVSSLFLARLALHVDVFFMCLWGEVSSMSSYPITLITLQKFFLLNWYGIIFIMFCETSTNLISTPKEENMNNKITDQFYWRQKCKNSIYCNTLLYV